MKVADERETESSSSSSSKRQECSKSAKSAENAESRLASPAGDAVSFSISRDAHNNCATLEAAGRCRPPRTGRGSEQQPRLSAAHRAPATAGGSWRCERESFRNRSLALSVPSKRQHTCPACPTGCVNTVEWSPCGTLLASGSDDMAIKFWSWQTGAQVLSFDSGCAVRPLPPGAPGGQAHTGWVLLFGCMLPCYILSMQVQRSQPAIQLSRQTCMHGHWRLSPRPTRLPAQAPQQRSPGSHLAGFE